MMDGYSLKHSCKVKTTASSQECSWLNNKICIFWIPNFWELGIKKLFPIETMYCPNFLNSKSYVYEYKDMHDDKKINPQLLLMKKSGNFRTSCIKIFNA